MWWLTALAEFWQRSYFATLDALVTGTDDAFRDACAASVTARSGSPDERIKPVSRAA